MMITVFVELIVLFFACLSGIFFVLAGLALCHHQMVTALPYLEFSPLNEFCSLAVNGLGKGSNTRVASDKNYL